MDGTDDGMLWNDNEEDGGVSSESEEGEGTDCEDLDCDTGEGRQNLTCFAYLVYEINSKMFFLSWHLFLGGVILHLDKYIFAW